MIWIVLAALTYPLIAAYLWTGYRSASRHPRIERLLLLLAAPLILPTAIYASLVGALLGAIDAGGTTESGQRGDGEL